MKKIITIILLSVTFFCNAQQAIEPANKPIQDMSLKTKKAKPLFLLSGASFVIGSIISYNSAITKEPDPAEYTTNMGLYETKYKTYSKQQKNARKTTAILYGVGGLALAVGAVISF